MEYTDTGPVRDVEWLINILPSEDPHLTEVRTGNKKGAKKGWKEPKNLLTTSQARQKVKNGGNVGIRLGLDHEDGTKFIVLDVEEEGGLPNEAVDLIMEHELAVWRTPHGGLNRLLAVSFGAYNLLDAVPTQIDLDEDGNHELELLTDGHSLIPPSVINHRQCRESKPCNGEGQDGYRLDHTNSNGALLTEEVARELLNRLGIDSKEVRMSDEIRSDVEYELPSLDEELADVGEIILQTLRDEHPKAFISLMELLQGGTGGYDDLLNGGDGIDRSQQELMALTRLHETVLYLGNEEDGRAEVITRSTFERYVRGHPTTTDQQVRKWLKRDSEDDNYRENHLKDAIDACDQGKFNRFLNGDPREDEWRSWTGDYSDVTYSKVRLTLDLCTGKLNPFFETVEDLRETVATFYEHDPNEEALRDLLDNPPAPVHGTTPNSGCVSPVDYPAPAEIAKVAKQLDERDNGLESYKEALRRLRRAGIVKLARMGRQYVVYPAHLPDPPDSIWVKCNGEKSKPTEPHPLDTSEDDYPQCVHSSESV